ncbi:hypothetical protein M378DRAFT_160965 [Amanita muscaria Koide BX008]|uniref:Uncharacterized protein n=1 Tax=Amanita muscaria (strain Koide BX008) TaxID=946122 RepID=A0A0C2THT3_AMAMK|nr:hypothetical protein M378DRAFT_160965 [Amanita muscaria Koide BX008]
MPPGATTWPRGKARRRRYYCGRALGQDRWGAQSSKRCSRLLALISIVGKALQHNLPHIRKTCLITVIFKFPDVV